MASLIRADTRRALFVTSAVALLAAVLTTGAAGASGNRQPAPPVPVDRYDMAGGCYSIGNSDGYVARTPTGGFVVAADPGLGAPFHFQATALGSYLLYTDDERFLTADGPTSSAVAGARASPLADLDVDGPVDGFTFVLPASRSGAGRGDLQLATMAGGTLGFVDPASVGAAGAFRIEPARGCAPFPEIAVDVTGTPRSNPDPAATVRGLLETHMHGMAFEFIGGRARCGRPWHPYGVAAAMVDCPDHEPGGYGATLEAVVSDGSVIAPHDTTGWPTFVDWPDPHSLTHEGAYYRWIERAYRAGLRTYVNLLVDNTALCEVWIYKKNSCNEMDGVRLQAKRLHEFEDYIDAQNGGPGEGWFRIVTDPVQAREVINSGKLAVVVGIEISVLFDCGEKLDVPQCTADEIDTRLDEVYALGVRQMELVNKFDNALTGVAGDGGTTGVIVNTGNKHVTGHYWDMQTCAHVHDPETSEVPAPATDRRQINLEDDLFSMRPDQFGFTDQERDRLAGAVFAIGGVPGAASPTPVYPEGPHCNSRGLTELGVHAIEGMAERGILFDPDHMSALARTQALDVIARLEYPGVLSSHSWADEPSIPKIYALGGLVTPYAGGAAGFVDKWVNHKRLALDHGVAEEDFGFGYGADMNGFGGQGGPRFNPGYENGGDPLDDVDYPFASYMGDTTVEQHTAGERVYDLNVDGVAHYGMYADWYEDIRIIAETKYGRGAELVDDMLKGPEAYLTMWERATFGTGDHCAGPQDEIALDDIHALVGLDQEAIMRTFGAPLTRDGGLTYCIDDGTNPPQMVTVSVAGGTATEVSARAATDEELGRGPTPAERVAEIDDDHADDDHIHDGDPLSNPVPGDPAGGDGTPLAGAPVDADGSSSSSGRIVVLAAVVLACLLAGGVLAVRRRSPH